MVRKRLCACGCGNQVTAKLEFQHLNVLTPTILASQVLNRNQTVIRRKKRSHAVGFSTSVHQRLGMSNNNPASLDSSMMMGEDLDEAVLPDRNSSNEDFPMDHAGPSALSDDDDIYMDDIYMDDPASLRHTHDDPASPHHTHNDPTSPHHTHNDPASPHHTHNDPASPHHTHVDDSEVYGLSNLRRSQRIAGNVEQISQRRWGSNVRADFVNNRESDEEEEEDIEDDGDFDIDVDSDGLEGYEDDDDELFAGPGQEGISLWDSLGDGFLKEVSQLGML
jgi:hypothetical protein